MILLGFNTCQVDLCAELETSVTADDRAGGVRSIRSTEHSDDASSFGFVCLIHEQ